MTVHTVAGKVSVEHGHEYFSTETSSPALMERQETGNFI